MKLRHLFSPRLLSGGIATFISICGPAAHATSFYWDGGGVDIAGNGNGASAGGAGDWSTALANWDVGVSPHVVWPSSGTDNDALLGGTGGLVTLQAPVAVNDITFSTTDYVVTGTDPNSLTLNGSTATITAGTGISAIISAPVTGVDTSIVKAGDGMLTLSSANTYTGLTTISSGILKLGNATALGTQLGASDGTIVTAGATLDLGGAATGTGREQLTVSGNGAGGIGAITSSTAIANPFIGVRFLTLAGDTTLGFTNRWDVGSNTLLDNFLIGGGHTLTITGSGPGQASLNNLGETDLGDINLNLGSAATSILYLQGSTTLGRPANTLNITGGSTLNVFTSSTVTSYDKKIALDSGNISVGKTGGTTFAGIISLANSNIITATTAVTATNAISGTGALVKAGASSLALSGTNTYGGGTSVNAGILDFVNIAAQPTSGTTVVASTGALALGTGGTGYYSATDVDNLFSNTLANVVLDPASGVGIDTSAGDFTYNGNPAAARPFTKLGANTLTLTGISPYTGTTTISAGTLKLTGGINPLSTTAAITIGTAGTLDLGGYSQTTTGAVVFSSGGTLQNGTLTATNAGLAANGALSGTITVGAGGALITNQRLLVGNVTTRALTLSSSSSGSLTFGGDANAAMNYVGVGNAGNGTLTINGGTVNFTNVAGGNGYFEVGSNSNTATGAVVVNGGNINVGTVMKLGGNYLSATGTNATSSLTITNGTVAVGGGSSAGTVGTTGLNGVLYMNGHAGNNTANTGKSTLTLNGGGVLSVNQIQAGNGGTKTINFNGGTLRAATSDANFLSPATGLTVNVNTGGAIIDTQAFNPTITAALVAGTTTGGGLTKIGMGTLTLMGANTYTGPTIVNEGTLSLSSPTLANGAAVSVASGAILNLNFPGTDYVNSLTLGGTTFTSGTFDSTHPSGLITGTGTIQISSFATWAAALGVPTTGDSDNDGLSNLVEYALGSNPTQPSPTPGTFNGGILSFTKGSEALANGDVTYEIEQSTTLTGWTVVVGNDPAQSTISYTLPTGQPTAFARLKVTRTP